MSSEDSSPDPLALCACGHPHANHTSVLCAVCWREKTAGYMHAFRLPEAEPLEAPIVDAELEALKTEVDQLGAEGVPVEVVSSNDRCTCGHKRKKHSSAWSAGWVKEICHKCSDKDVVTWDHAFELAPGAEPGDVDDSPYGCPACDANQEAFEAQLRGEEMVPRPSPVMHRRPPYAVAYSIEGGHLYEVGLPGDATVTAEDGVLKISHPSAVLALVQSRPMTFQETAVEEREDRA